MLLNIDADTYLSTNIIVLSFIQANIQKESGILVLLCLAGNISLAKFEELAKLGVETSSFDKALFIYRKKGAIEGIMIVHVDDFLWC